MTIAPKIWEFPAFPVAKQIFWVPGSSIEGGFTSGGVRMSSPEPGGRGMLKIQPSLQIDEFNAPVSSWIMSKINGQVCRLRLAPTPQVASSRITVPWGAESVYPDSQWNNLQNWSGDLDAIYALSALEGTNSLRVNLNGIGAVLRIGQVIGHKDSTYLIDEIVYDDTFAVMKVIPPLRRDVTAGDMVYFRPYFTGSIANGDEIIQTYDAENNGHIQLPTIIFSEVVTP